MDTRITEPEFTASIASWVNVILDRDPSLPFKEARCEQRGYGSRTRRDLTLIDASGKVALTGEIKLPYAQDGATPRNDGVVDGARKKAEEAGSPYFFTWNVNEMILWETFKAGVHHQDRNYRRWVVSDVRTPADLAHPIVEKQIKRWLGAFLGEYAQIYLGKASIGVLPPDEKFIDTLESFLARPIHLTLEQLEKRAASVPFRAELDEWMRDKLGLVLSDAPDDIRDNRERAAKSACYVLLNRLVFYEAMIKRYGRLLGPLQVPEHVRTGDGLLEEIMSLFRRACEATADYETVFGEDPRDLGARVPFYSDEAVPHWRELVKGIHRFDFTKLNYDVIGRIFERLVGPEERHKYGQFFTRPEVVDLINAFCVRKADATVMDPACGAGTFLVRAYARKKTLDPTRAHGQLLKELYGVDFSAFATHLCTINLATRDLIDEENYPQIARSDFFDTGRHLPLLTLPSRSPVGAARGTTSAGEARRVMVPLLDAIVSNPPYQRQEEIRSSRNKKGAGPRPGTKEYYMRQAEEESGIRFSGRSDLHCYFWPHASSFLRDSGYLGFLTSSQWLDVEYGFRLQEFLLKNYEILAVIESLDEPWFVGARVQTAISILRKQPDENKRMRNIVRFVQLRAPMGELLFNDGTEPGRQGAAESLRDEIVALGNDTVNARYRARLVPQSKLWEDGVSLGKALGKKPAETNESFPEDPPGDMAQGPYYGGKWGIYLRAPDLWFDILDETRGRWVPLGELAEVRFGVKSGKDCFFFVRDVSAQMLTQEPREAGFERRFGVDRRSVASGRVALVRCGEKHGEIRPIESRFLEPEVHSLMEVKRYTVEARDCARKILLVSAPKKKLRGTYVLRYIEWGESQEWHKGSTCAARAAGHRAWYDLTGHRRGALFWPKSQQYKHLAPANDAGLVCSNNLYDVFAAPGLNLRVLAGLLNSTWVTFSKYQYGRPVGVEGNLKTEVVDVNMMLVPDPRQASDAARRKVAVAFERMKSRHALQFLSPRRLRRMAYTLAGKTEELELLSDMSELDMADRRQLDDAVLQVLGVRSAARRGELIEALYRELHEMFEAIRDKEEKAADFKKRAKRKTRLTPRDVALQIIREIEASRPRLLLGLLDFIPTPCATDTYELPHVGQPSFHADMFEPNGLKFGRKHLISVRSPAQARLLLEAWRAGIRGAVSLPQDGALCEQVHRDWLSFTSDREEALRKLAAERTADEDMQADIMVELSKLLTRRHVPE